MDRTLLRITRHTGRDQATGSQTMRKEHMRQGVDWTPKVWKPSRWSACLARTKPWVPSKKWHKTSMVAKHAYHQGRQIQGDGELKTSLAYRVRLRPAWPTRTHRQANTDSPRARMRTGGRAVPLRRKPPSNLPLPCAEDWRNPEELSL